MQTIVEETRDYAIRYEILAFSGLTHSEIEALLDEWEEK